jgi:hypothetical protein
MLLHVHCTIRINYVYCSGTVISNYSLKSSKYIAKPEGGKSAIVIQADSFSQSVLSRRADQVYFSAIPTLSSFAQQ